MTQIRVTIIAAWVLGVVFGQSLCWVAFVDQPYRWHLIDALFPAATLIIFLLLVLRPNLFLKLDYASQINRDKD